VQIREEDDIIEPNAPLLMKRQFSITKTNKYTPILSMQERAKNGIQTARESRGTSRIRMAVDYN
jgi:hypothetical protein